MKLVCRERTLDLARTAIMGVLNVTPDSFSDGGLWVEPRDAIEHALRMVDEGAAVVDVGGESTRPGARPVAESEEMDRVLPVIAELAGRTQALISIDTRKPAVARAAIDAGAHIVNDTLGEETTGEIDSVAADTRAALVVMHSRGTPETMRSLARYGDVVAEVADFLRNRATQLEERGVGSDSIVVDPGFGFAKTAAHALEMLRRLEVFVAIGSPVLVGTSRKSFIGDLLDLPLDERVEATAASSAWAVTKGARIVRVHDVAPVARAVRMTEAILGVGSTG